MFALTTMVWNGVKYVELCMYLVVMCMETCGEWLALWVAPSQPDFRTGCRKCSLTCRPSPLCVDFLLQQMIAATAVCGMVYAALAGQPLTIIGSTGPVLAFIAVLYKTAARMVRGIF